MIFRKINYFDTNSGKSVCCINKRLEYFHNYWSFLFQKNSKLLFITNEKFESHRTLLKKLEDQVEYNPYNGIKRIEAIINHSYFDKVNSWIEAIIYEVYAERNLETHNSISSDISSIKLKDTFLFIGSVLYQVLINNCTNNTTNIEDVLITIKK